MFDFAEGQPGGGWEDEPSEEEIIYCIEQLKRNLISVYRLQATDLKLQLPKPFRDCLPGNEVIENILYTAARKCLEQNVFVVKTTIPRRHHRHFEMLLSDWMPQID